MFYATHLRPHLAEALSAEFDFYIDFKKLSSYIFDYVPPELPPGEPVNLFDVSEEVNAYNAIIDTKLELEVPQWRELIMRGQLEEI